MFLTHTSDTWLHSRTGHGDRSLQDPQVCRELDRHKMAERGEAGMYRGMVLMLVCCSGVGAFPVHSPPPVSSTPRDSHPVDGVCDSGSRCLHK